jgi:hypothetical protein
MFYHLLVNAPDVECKVVRITRCGHQGFVQASRGRYVLGRRRVAAFWPGDEIRELPLLAYVVEKVLNCEVPLEV